MQFIKKNGFGILLCMAIAIPSWFAGKAFPIIGGAVIAILAGMVITLVWKWREPVESGIKFVSKKVLQWAVILRTLAIIPITLVLAFVRTRQERGKGETKLQMSKIFPFFILFFIAASVITTVAVSNGISASVFDPLKGLSKFLIVLAMAAIGLNTNIVKLVKSGGKPIALGACCWVAIPVVSLALQFAMGLV